MTKDNLQLFRPSLVTPLEIITLKIGLDKLSASNFIAADLFHSFHKTTDVRLVKCVQQKSCFAMEGETSSSSTDLWRGRCDLRLTFGTLKQKDNSARATS